MSFSATKFGIRGKIILLALVCAVLPSAVISVLAVRSSREALEQGVRVELSGFANEQMSRLTSAIERARTDLGTWGTLNTMQNALIDDVDRVIQDELAGLRKRYENFGELLVLNPSGNVIASALEHNRGLNLAEEEFFKAGLLGEFSQGDVRQQTLTGQIGIAIATPIRANYDQSTIIGVLVGIIDWPHIQDELRNVRIWGARQDSNHKLILTTATGEVLFQGSADAEVPTALLTLSNGVSVLDIDGQQFLVGTKAALQSGNASASGWALHAMVSADIAYANISVLRNRIATLSAAIIAAALLLGALGSSRWIVTPIKRVTAVMREVSRGKVDLNLTGKSRRDEVGEMLRSISVFRTKMLEQNRMLSERDVRFDAALSNMSQGLAMFDANGKLVVCNRRFTELYKLPTELSEAGSDVEEIENRFASTREFDHSSVFRPHDDLGGGKAGTVFFGAKRRPDHGHPASANGWGWVGLHS